MADTEYYTTDDEPSLRHQASSDTSYQTPMLSASRRSSGRQTPSSFTPSTPLASEAFTNSKEYNANGGVHGFTPSLHASLVSEILSLRRELDSKHGTIEKLEGDLSSVKAENEGLHENLAKHAKESRAVKKQLQSIEDGTLTAIEELVKERDQANAGNAELRRKLDSTQKKVKSHEEEAERTYKTWEQDKSKWLDERRVLERKIHVTEGRLRAVIEEVAAHHEAAAAIDVTQRRGEDVDDPISAEAMAPDNPVRARHRSSVNSIHSVRNSYADGSGSMGLSLAQELEQGEDDDADDADEEDHQADTVDEEAQEQDTKSKKSRNPSRRALYQDDKARKVLGMQPHSREQSLDSGVPSSEPRLSGDLIRQSGAFGSPKRTRNSMDISPEVLSGSPPGKVKQMVQRLSMRNQRASTPVQLISNARVYRETVSGTTKYVSTGVQFSPPSTPTATASSPAWDSVWESVFGENHADPARSHGDHQANQRKKRESIATSIHHHTRTKSEPMPGRASPNKSAEDPPSPPASLHSKESPLVEPAAEAETVSVKRIVGVELREASTQTEADVEKLEEKAEAIPPPPNRAPPPPPPFVVPAIAIHPPDNASASSVETVLPPGTRNVGCQTDFDDSRPTRSVSVQTEGIRVDLRSARLPAHLLPSAIADIPTKEKAQGKERLASRMTQKATGKSRDTTPSPPPVPPLPVMKNDEPITADLDESRWTRLKRSLRSGPEPNMIDEMDDTELSDGDYTTQLPTTRSHRGGKQGRTFDPPTPVPEDEKVVINRPQGHARGRMSGGSRNSIDRSSRNGRPYQLPRVSNMRHGSSSTTNARSRSPSFGSNASSSYSKGSGPPPPFAIPARSSSAGVTRNNRRKDSESPTRRTPRDSHDGNLKRLAKKPPILRKVQSAAVLDEDTRSEDLYMMPPTPHSLVSFPGSSPRTSNVTRDTVSVAQHSRATPSTQSSQLQNFGVVSPTGTASVGSSVQHSVVDAITATMIGEWMWKYVRKRKSFGVSDQSQDFSKDTRHKRWVWLSPYERTIMWSTKQPNSNAALMGKNGRTFSIQSVLDVKDETPAPKPPSEIFSRSILVLTPTRALKFTATTRERHYLWLTALSFLAHHTQTNPPDINFLPSLPSPHESNSATTRSLASSVKKGNASSVRASNEKSIRSQQSSGPVTPNIQEVDESTYMLDYTAEPESAFAPTVPRVPIHSRKRSATNPVPSSRNGSSLRSPVSTTAGSSNNSMLSTGATPSGRSSSGPTAIKTQPSPSSTSFPRNVLTLRSTGASLSPNTIFGEYFDNPLTVPEEGSGTEATPRTSNVSELGANNNFFDAVGMVRMDAFVSPGVTLGPKAAKSSSAGATANQSRTGSRGDGRGGIQSAGRDSTSRAPGNDSSKGAALNSKIAGNARANALHGKGEGSGDSFIGPPNISRSRQGILRRTGILGGRGDE